MQHVVAHSIDAVTGISAAEAPCRNGPVKPHPDLAITLIDRRARPHRILGRLPNGIAHLAITPIAAAEYDAHAAEISA